MFKFAQEIFISVWLKTLAIATIVFNGVSEFIENIVNAELPVSAECSSSS